MRKIIWGSIFISLLSVPVYCQELTGKQMVDNIAQEFQVGNVSEAEVLALKALHSEVKFSREELFDIHKYLAFCYVAYGQREKAIKEFIELLALNKDFRFDSKIYSPKIIAVFEEALVEKERLRQAEKDLKTMSPYLIQMKAGLRSLLFPGRGQLFKREQLKGYSLIAGESLTIIGLILSELQYEQAHKDYLNASTAEEIEKRYKKYNNWYKLRNASAALGIGIYLYSFFDSVYSPVNRSALGISLSPDGKGVCLTVAF